MDPQDGPVYILLLIIVKETQIFGGNNKTVVRSAACSISDLFGKGEPILGSAYAATALSFEINQISDSSQAYNCVVSFISTQYVRHGKRTFQSYTKR